MFFRRIRVATIVSRQIIPLLLITIVLSTPCYGKISIDNISITNMSKEIRISATLHNGFTENIVEAIESGVPVTFTYYLELCRKVPMWFDNKVSMRTIKRSLQYDTLKKEYEFTYLDDKESSPKIIKGFDEIKELITRLDDVSLGSSKMLNPNNKYYVRIRANMKSKRPWFPFNYILFFFSFFDFDTSWEKSSPFIIKKIPIK
ncbi:MAG: DUF4390 domain-containing protein [Nitrospinae bacterium]|nr:DUF4390 domain-containing protein [Nitrospinota bacterium]